jgi:adenylate cyclase 10
VTTVQQQIYRLQGSVNKLVMDDKGSTFICLWGVCPLSHEDDAARAILTGFNIARELDKIEHTKCKIGISSGEVFSGVVGTAGSRKEFSVLGDVVNLAARIMGSLKYSNKTMCCDLNTRNLAAPFFNFNYIAHKEFKGKSISLAVFEPIDPQTVLV